MFTVWTENPERTKSTKYGDYNNESKAVFVAGKIKLKIGEWVFVGNNDTQEHIMSYQEKKEE